MIQKEPFGSFEARWGKIGKPSLSSKEYPGTEWFTKLGEKHAKGYETIIDETSGKFINNVLKFNKLIDAVRDKGTQSELEYVMSYKVSYVIKEQGIPYDAKVSLNEIWRKYKPKEE